MAAEDFFSRWSRRKTGATEESVTGVSADAPSNPAPPQAQALPTLDDVARLTPESDFSPYLAQGVDEAVKRSAMKKLFADPHFNIMDGLDIYIGDYSRPDPMPAEMLAALRHAKALLDPLAQFDKPQLPLDETVDVAEVAAPSDTLHAHDGQAAQLDEAAKNTPPLTVAASAGDTSFPDPTAHQDDHA